MTYWPREVLIFKQIFQALSPKSFNFHLAELDFSSYSSVSIVGLGKAAPFMVSELYNKIVDFGEGDKLARPLVFTKYGHAFQNDYFDCLESGHPLCDKNSFLAGEKLKNRLLELENNELLIVCLSGGASSLVEIPVPLFSPEEICEIHCALLLGGADIVRMNKLRGELSLLKNGGIASLSGTHNILTYAISDVPVDDFSVIGSGPTALNDEDFETVAKIAMTFLKGDLLEKVLAYLESSARRNFLSMKKDILSEKDINNIIVENFYSMREKVLNILKKSPDVFYFFDKPFNCSIEEGIERHLAKIQAFDGPFSLFSGGEFTYEVQGDGKGGRNTEFVLRMTKLLFDENVLKWPKEKLDRLLIASVGTDGTDGVTSCAGAWMNYEVFKRAQGMGIDLEEALDNNDSFTYFERLQTLIYTGPTETNVMDLRYIALS